MIPNFTKIKSYLIFLQKGPTKCNYFCQNKRSSQLHWVNPNPQKYSAVPRQQLSPAIAVCWGHIFQIGPREWK